MSLGFYTANMGGVDRADQFRSYYTIVRQSRKRYRYIFWFLFNVAACNRYILECEYRRIRNLRKRPQDPLELGKRLIDDYSYRSELKSSTCPRNHKKPASDSRTRPKERMCTVQICWSNNTEKLSS